MSLLGSLESFSLPDILSLISQLKKTGLLSLVSEQDEQGILFHRGNLVYATGRGGVLRLGNFLVKMGFISENELGNFQGSREPMFLGQELLARGVIQRDELHMAVRAQILDVLDAVLLWENGAFHFDEWDENSPDLVPTGPVIPTQNILLDVMRHLDESQAIRARFPNLAVILETTQELEGKDNLEESTREFVALVDGERSVIEILRESSLSKTDSSRILARLSEEGLVRPAPQPPNPHGPLSLPGKWVLPVSPDLPGRLYWILRQRGKHLDGLTEVISKEPTLAAKFIRQLHTARVKSPPTESLISRVVDTLGEFRTRTIVVPDLIRSVFFAEKDFFWENCRTHSVLTAELARHLAGLVGHPHPEKAYLSGLLHKLGIFILIGVYPERYRTILTAAKRQKEDLCRLEQDEFGLSHTRVGSTYAKKWLFPDEIRMAIDCHLDPRDGSGGQMVDLVALASWIASQNGPGMEFFYGMDDQVDGVLDRLKLKKQQVLQLSARGPNASINSLFAGQESRDVSVGKIY